MRILRPAALALACATAPFADDARAACRAREIITQQCIWFALDELGGDKAAAKRAEEMATSTLLGGCPPKEYQMVLLRGTDITRRIIERLRARGVRDLATVQSECAAAAARGSSR